VPEDDLQIVLVFSFFNMDVLTFCFQSLGRVAMDGDAPQVLQ